MNPMMKWLYDLFLWTFSVLVDLFFREVHPRGSWKIPRRGPVIFVAAPHANQAGYSLDVAKTSPERKLMTILVRRPPHTNARHLD